MCGGIATINSTNAKPPPPLAAVAAAAGANRRGRRTCTRPPREGDAVEQQTRKRNRASYSISRVARHAEIRIFDGILVSLGALN